ncbi:MAG: glycosyltransferase family 2 protein [Patescibacteria group bacterium]
MDAPILSINIVSYNTKRITLDCLRSIERSVKSFWLTDKPAKDIEIVIVDNASPDGSADEIATLSQNYSLPIKLIRNSENAGFGRGHNLAAKNSSGELLLLLNTDTIIQKDAILTLVREYLEHNPSKLEKFKKLISDKSYGEKWHFLGPKLLNNDFSPQPSCGPYYSIPVIIGALFLKGDYYGLTRYSPNEITSVDWVSGAAFICKKEYFDELQGFDEGIFMYMEEIDLLKRARDKGMTVWFTSKANIVHLGSASSNKQYPIYQVYRGFLYLYKKHHSKLEFTMVQSILRLKSYISIIVGTIFNKPKIVETYKNSLAIISENSNSK